MKVSTTTRLLLVLSVLALLLAACTPAPSQGGATNPPPTTQSGGSTTAQPSAPVPDAGDESNFYPPGQYPIVKEQETLSVFTYLLGTKMDHETNWMTKFYEEMTNVAVRWVVAPTEQFMDKLNLSLAGGDPLDVIICGGNSTTAVSMPVLLKYANQGMILPLEDLIENHSIYFKERLDEYPGWREAITTPEGHIYSFPSLNECYHCMYYGKMWINQEFLKNVGLDIPTTTDEFYEMLVAFRDQDANGNGDPTDEIPMIGATDSFGAKIDTYLMSAFIYDDGENRLFLRDGTVTAAFAQPEFQEGLRYLNMLFDEGLIYKESFTQNRTTRNQINSQKYESLAGAMPNIHHGIGNRGEGEPQRWLEYIPIEPLVGPDGLQITRYDYYAKFQTILTSGMMPSTCKNPELVIRWLDWFMSEEGTMTLLYGPEGIGREMAEEGSKGVDGSPAVYKRIVMEEEDEYSGNLTWGQQFPNYHTTDMKNGLQQPDDMLAEDGSGLESFLYKYSKEHYEPYGIALEDLIPPLFYSEAAINEQSMLTTNINTYVEEAIARFIIGDLDVDSDWDSYLKELNVLGLDRYLQIVQETYDASAFSK
ncbi:MAG: extracellular solute-binding protein [Christensenellales bacterium]